MDIVSALPDGVLEKIVSLLPLKDMLRTSLLSRRWRRVWTTVLAFNFTDAADANTNVYISRIDSCLQHLSASPSCMTIPSIVFPAIQDSDVVDRWIRFAAAHNVTRLKLAARMEYAPPIPFPLPLSLPLSLFQLCRGLTALDIFGYEIPAVLDPAIGPAFPSLRSLSLEEVTIADPPAFFAQCPAIERLTAELFDEADLLPASAFRSCPLLSTLNLGFCTIPREPPSAGPPAFPSLRALKLGCVRVAAPQSLLNSCPVIAELTIMWTPAGFAFRLDPPHTISTLRIFDRTILHCSHPSPSVRTLVLFHARVANPPALVESLQGLEYLSLTGVGTEPGADSGILVWAPRMRLLMVQDSEKLGTVVVADTPQLCRLFYWGDMCLLEVFERAVPKLEEAFLHCMVENPFGDGGYPQWKILMQPLSHVRLLSVNWWFIHEFMRGCPAGSERLKFDELKEFHWWTGYKKDAEDPYEQRYMEKLSPTVVSSLFTFLECCPNVQHLCVVSTCGVNQSTPPAVSSPEENEDEFVINIENSILTNQIEGLQISQRVRQISWNLLPQLKEFTLYQFSGELGDICLLSIVGLRCCALRHIRLHYVEGSRGATHRIQSSLRSHFFKLCPNAILHFLKSSSDKTCPMHSALNV